MKQATEPTALAYRPDIAVHGGADLCFGETTFIENFSGIAEVDFQLVEMRPDILVGQMGSAETFARLARPIPVAEYMIARVPPTILLAVT